MAVNDEKALVAQLFAARDLSTPERAAASIRAWRDLLTLVGTIAELQVMEALSVIRRHLPERDRFDSFCAEHLDGILEPDEAWNRALTWEVSGRQRALKEFAQASPAEATAFVRDFADALGPARIDQLDEDDREVAELLAAPPRARRKQLRELVATRRAVESASAAPGELQLRAARGGPPGAAAGRRRPRLARAERAGPGRDREADRGAVRRSGRAVAVGEEPAAADDRPRVRRAGEDDRSPARRRRRRARVTLGSAARALNR